MNVVEKHLLPSLFFLVLVILFIAVSIWGWILKRISRRLFRWEKGLKEQERRLEQNKAKNEKKEEELEKKDAKNSKLFQQIMLREEAISRQFSEKTQAIAEEKADLEKKKTFLENARKQILEHLKKATSLDVLKAREILLSMVKQDMEQKLNDYKRELVENCRKEAEVITTGIICSALEKISSKLTISRTSLSIIVNKRDIISRIIGKEGRNIKFFKKISGVDLVIEEEEKGTWTIQLSSFNSVRREKAYQAMLEIVEGGRVSPAQIESIYKEVDERIDELMAETGKETLQSLEITGVNSEMVLNLGRLKYRYSFGQSVLQHSLEVAIFSGNIAAELNLDVGLARRAGLFHDIGKANEEQNSNSHVQSGLLLARTCNEPPEVVNAIASHHFPEKANNFYSLIVIAADKMSASRVGARGFQEEVYLARMNSLEKIISGYPGISKSYAFQAGRELWVFVDSEKLDDTQTWELSEEIKKKIKKEHAIPGRVVVHVVREKRFDQVVSE